MNEAEKEAFEIAHLIGVEGFESESWGPFTYWYEGPPDYVARADYPDRFDREYRTAVCCCLYGYPDTPDGWERVAEYQHSGEGSCPNGSGGWPEYIVGQEEWRGLPRDDDEKPCQFCEAEFGHEHTTLYIGDGWCEIVYRRKHVEFEVSHIDTCFVDYLTDHHNREGELMIGIETMGQSLEEIVDHAFYDLTERLPDDLPFADSDLQEAIRRVARQIDFRPHNQNGLQTSDVETAAESQPSVWLLLTWR